LEQVPAGHVTLVQTPPEQLPIPFIALAEASAVNIGEKLHMVNTIKATLVIQFMTVLSVQRSEYNALGN
jgi:hypothetical protein